MMWVKWNSQKIADWLLGVMVLSFERLKYMTSAFFVSCKVLAGIHSMVQTS